MSLVRILFVFLLGFNMVACNDTEAPASSQDPATDPAADPDNDGLSNEQELTIYFTAPNIADTDGDGISDGDEVNELGFNAASNPYRFNPLIADLPDMGINFETVPKLVLRFTDSAGTNQEFSSSTGGKEIDKSTVTNSGTVSLTVGIEKSVKVGMGAGVEGKVTASLTGSYTNTTEDTTENHKTWNDVTTNGSFATRNTDGASLRVGISLENTSNLTYSLEHITLLVSYMQSDASQKPIATLSYDTTGGGFQRTSFGPGDRSNLLLFSNDNLDLGTALELLKDARNMIVQPALFELTNAEGVPIAFDEGEVDAKTAEIIIDYGVVQPMESYRVAVLGSQGEGSLTIDTLLGSILNVNYVDSGGFTRLRDVGGDADSRWVVLVTHNDGFMDSTTLYDPSDASYDISNIEIFPSDQVSIIYLTDVDGDGVGIREEALNGTDPEKADTDGDGVTDDIEIRNAILVNAIHAVNADRYPAYVFSNPVLADADGDQLNDLQERERGLDPNNADTDGDGISDLIDDFNGQQPISAKFTLIPTGKDSIKLMGTATAEAGTTIASIDVDWDFVGAPGISTQTAVGTASSLTVNLSKTYSTPLDVNNYTVLITVTNNDGYVVTYSGSVEVYQELTTNSFTQAMGWREDKHIRELVDVNGDGNLDLIGFGNSAVEVSLWNGSNFGPVSHWLSNNYGSAPAGGNYSKTLDPRFVIDYDADGLNDIVAFSPNGAVWSKNIGGAFSAPVVINSGYGSAGGWNTADHLRLVADIDGNGTPDLIGFGTATVYTFLSGGVSSHAIEATNEFTPADDGWNSADHYRFVRDMDGDGKADIVGFGSGSMFIALGQNDGTFASAVNFKTGAQSFTKSNGWRPKDYPIFLEDVDNDGKLDIVGFGYDAVHVMINNSTVGDVAFSDPTIWNGDFVRRIGWEHQQNRNPRFIADINNDGYKDIAGFGNAYAAIAANQLPNDGVFDRTAAVITSRFNTGSDWTFVDNSVSSNWPFPSVGGEGVIQLYNSRYVRDVNSDGRADMVGFGNAGVITQRMLAITQPVEQ